MDAHRDTNKFKSLEALRGIAAILVVAFHLTAFLGDIPADRFPFTGLFLFGRAGVDFFFVLSGFIITQVHSSDIGKPDRIARFWVKRAVRILPLYLLVFAVGSLIQPPAHIQDLTALQVTGALLDSFCNPGSISQILGAGWSLRNEVLFYGIFSILILNRSLGLLALTAWLTAIVWNIAYEFATGLPYFTAHATLFEVFNVQFFFGIAAALAPRRLWAAPPRILTAVGAVGFLMTGLIESFGRLMPFPVPIPMAALHIAYATAAALSIYGLVSQRNGAVAVPRLLLRLGAASYSIYLLHIPIYYVVLMNIINPLALSLYATRETMIVILLPSIVFLALHFSEAVEQPMLRAMQQRLRGTSGGRLKTSPG